MAYSVSSPRRYGIRHVEVKQARLTPRSKQARHRHLTPHTTTSPHKAPSAVTTLASMGYVPGKHTLPSKTRATSYRHGFSPAWTQSGRGVARREELQKAGLAEIRKREMGERHESQKLRYRATVCIQTYYRRHGVLVDLERQHTTATFIQRWYRSKLDYDSLRFKARFERQTLAALSIQRAFIGHRIRTEKRRELKGWHELNETGRRHFQCTALYKAMYRWAQFVAEKMLAEGRRKDQDSSLRMAMHMKLLARKKRSETTARKLQAEMEHELELAKEERRRALALAQEGRRSGNESALEIAEESARRQDEQWAAEDVSDHECELEVLRREAAMAAKDGSGDADSALASWDGPQELMDSIMDNHDRAYRQVQISSKLADSRASTAKLLASTPRSPRSRSPALADRARSSTRSPRDRERAAHSPSGSRDRKPLMERIRNDPVMVPKPRIVPHYDRLMSRSSPGMPGDKGGSQLFSERHDRRKAVELRAQKAMWTPGGSGTKKLVRGGASPRLLDTDALGYTPEPPLDVYTS